MSNVIYLGSTANTLQPPQCGIPQRKLAQALLLKLNHPKKGDIAAILEPYNNDNDLECITHWLTSNQHRLASPFDINQCFEFLCYELNERTTPG